MARRPFVALGVFTTPHGEVIVRKVKSRKQKSWILVLEGPHPALRSMLPAWNPRAESTRTQVTPPTPMRTASEIQAWYHQIMPQWLENVKKPPEEPKPDTTTYRTLGSVVAVVDTEIASALRASTVETYRMQWRTIARYLPDNLPLVEITRERLQALIGKLNQDGYRPTMIRNLMRLVHRVLVRAVDDGALTRNPLMKVKLPRAITRPRRYLSREERDRLLETACQHGRDIHLFVGLGVFLGLRRSEALHLRFEHIEVEKRVVQVENSDTFTTKNAKGRSIPINDALLALLKLYWCDSGFVLNPDKAGRGRYRWDFRRLFATVVSEAGVPGISPHELRHTFASLAIQAGVNIAKVAKWLGHSTTKFTEIYAHLIEGYDSDVNDM